MLVWLFIFWHIVALDIAKSHLPLPGGDADVSRYWPIPLCNHLSSQPVNPLWRCVSCRNYSVQLGLSWGWACSAVGRRNVLLPFHSSWYGPAGSARITQMEIPCLLHGVGSWGERLHPSPSWHLSSIPSVRLSWISKSSFCIARPWHRWAMTLGCEPLMIGVNQHTKDEQKGDC